ncbi:uncharacterized protein LOC141652126 [Silene latifolia]|uniref:uncharacterized protein LOC141652126 n=1 Tax=Silene latifolia TaxID=37657 RepID=UPI003D775730
MSENNQNNLLPNMPQSGPVDVKTVVGYGTLYGCAIANVGSSIKAPTYVVSSLAKYGMQSRFAGRRYGTVVGAVCFGGLTAAHAGLHNWRIQNRSIPENAWVNYTGLLATASAAFIGLTSFPGTTFLKGARNGIIGALLGFG